MIKKLWPYTRGYRKWVFLGILCSGAEAVFELLLPLVMGIDGIMYAAPAADLIAAILAAVFLKKEFGLMDRESGKEVFAGK